MGKSREITPEDIKAFRKREGLTQQDLARILNVGVNTVSRWENGSGKVTGTAAAVLGACIGTAAGATVASPVVGLGASGLVRAVGTAVGAGAVAGPVGVLAGAMIGASAFGIYQLLKKCFEPEDHKG